MAFNPFLPESQKIINHISYILMRKENKKCPFFYKKYPTKKNRKKYGNKH